MSKIFRKTKMLARLAAEGRTNQIDEKSLQIMECLDGHEAKPNLWQQTVYGETNAWYCTDNDGNQYPVNPIDCDDA